MDMEYSKRTEEYRKIGSSEEKKNMEKFDILGNLPLELAHEVLVRLTPEGLANSLKCKKWQHHMNNEYFWKSLNQKFEYDLHEEPNSKDYRKKFRSYSLHWKRRYMYNRYQECIVDNEAFRKIRVKFNRFHSFDCLHFDDRTLILGSREFSQFGNSYGKKVSLLIINSPTGLVKHEINFIHKTAIKHGNLLIAISVNFHLKIWNIENGECIIDVKMDDYNANDVPSKLLACQHLILIKAARRWNILENLYTFNMKTKQFAYLVDEWMDVCCTNDRIAILKYTGSIEILDSNLNFQMKLNCSEALRIIKALMNDDFLAKLYIATTTEDITLSVWNIKTKTHFKIPLFGHIAEIVLTPKKTLICIISALGLDIWDMSKQNRLFEITPKNYINNFILNERYILTSTFSLDKKVIQIWCLTTGRFVKGYLCEHNCKSSLKAATNSKLLYYKFVKYPQMLPDLWQICDYDCMSEVEHQ